jgi:hypothetical protein
MATTTTVSINDLTDEGLARALRGFERGIEDGIAGARRYPSLIAAIRVQQLSRFRLRMRYGAVDNHVGTDVYDRYYRHREAPTYRLAAHMDHARWKLGKSYVLDWS